MPIRNREILLVDDNPSDVELTIHALQQGQPGPFIQVAEDGKEALDYIFCRGNHQGRKLSDRPNVVLLDLKMPRMDGFQVLKTIREDPRSWAIPVVILTSSKEPQDLIQGYKLGASAFIQKPVDFADFRRVIREIGAFWLYDNEPPLPEAFTDCS